MIIFLEVVLPVLLIFLSGFLLQRWQRLNIKSISTVAIYVMTPALVFRTFYTTELDIQYLNIVLFSIILLAAMIGITKIYGHIRGMKQSTESALILSTAFMNSGNYGAPIILFAYGEKAFAYAVSLLVLHAILMNIFGVYYAARGKSGIKLAVQSVLKMPPTYATLLALLFNVLGIPVSENLLSALNLVAEAAIPTVMIILGMQLAEISLKSLKWEEITYGVMTRLFISPLIAVLIIFFLPLDPILQKVLIVSAAMPSAATTVMYAVQFDSEPKLVSSITFVTTIISIPTITILLSILR